MVGVAARMCFELELHREASYPLTQVDQSPEELTMLSPAELQKVRRQCSWCAFCLDRVVNITLGRHPAIHLEDIDVDFTSIPLHDHDEAHKYRKRTIILEH